MGELPMRDVFLSNGLTPLDTCSICLDPFSSTHVAVRFTCANACCHVFGDQCLRKWLLSGSINANKCPTCRRQLFHVQSDFVDTGSGEVVDVTQLIDSDNGADEPQRQERDTDEHEGLWNDGLSAYRDEELSYQHAHDEPAMSTNMGEYYDTDGADIEHRVDVGNHGRHEAETGFPIDLRDVTDPYHAYFFIRDLVQHFERDADRDDLTDRDLRSLVRAVCQYYGIDIIPGRRSVYWRHMCSMIKRLQRTVRGPGVSDDEIKQIWVGEMAEALDWRLDVHEANVGSSEVYEAFRRLTRQILE